MPIVKLIGQKFGSHMSKKISRDEELAWEVFLQGLDVTSSELVNGARKECENPLTLYTTVEKCTDVKNFNPRHGYLRRGMVCRRR